MNIKTIFLFACLSLPLLSQDTVGQEVIQGDLHVVWTHIGNDLVASLHSDDSNAASFRVTVRYRINAGDQWKTIVHHVDNDVSRSASPYWIPTTFEFSVWPGQILYSIVEEKIEELRPLVT